MLGDADRRIRLAVFDWLTRQREELGEALPRDLLVNFTLDGVRIPLLGPQGIFKPAACELPISIAAGSPVPCLGGCASAGTATSEHRLRASRSRTSVGQLPARIPMPLHRAPRGRLAHRR